MARKMDPMQRMLLQCFLARSLLERVRQAQGRLPYPGRGRRHLTCGTTMSDDPMHAPPPPGRSYERSRLRYPTRGRRGRSGDRRGLIATAERSPAPDDEVGDPHYQHQGHKDHEYRQHKERHRAPSSSPQVIGHPKIHASRRPPEPGANYLTRPCSGQPVDQPTFNRRFSGYVKYKPVPVRRSVGKGTTGTSWLVSGSRATHETLVSLAR
jgi:hypothetical protein